MGTETDRIEKKTVLRAPLDRVWRAVSDAREFGAWFGVDLEGPFVAGQRLRGKIVPTKADPDVAKMQEPYAGQPFEIVVDRIEPKTHLSFRWHPFAIEKGHDYSSEPMTRVAFDLEEVAGGTQLTITETGFDGIPASRRAKAFEANSGGWAHQASLVEKYLAHAR